jgi:hypothetical protein
MLRLMRIIRDDDRGAVVVETLLMFVFMITFISASIRTMKLHANNQQVYIEAHRKALLYVTSPFDVSYLADKIDPSNQAPEIPQWKDEYTPDIAEDMQSMLSTLDEDIGKVVAGHELRRFSLFNTDAFGMSDNPSTIDIEHKVHMIRPPWTFGGFPAVPGQEPIWEAPAVRTAIGEMIDEELIGFEVFGDPLREYLKMKPIWLKPMTFQEAGEGNY